MSHWLGCHALNCGQACPKVQEKHDFTSPAIYTVPARSWFGALPGCLEWERRRRLPPSYRHMKSPLFPMRLSMYDAAGRVVRWVSSCCSSAKIHKLWRGKTVINTHAVLISRKIAISDGYFILVSMTSVPKDEMKCSASVYHDWSSKLRFYFLRSWTHSQSTRRSLGILAVLDCTRKPWFVRRLQRSKGSRLCKLQNNNCEVHNSLPLEWPVQKSNWWLAPMNSLVFLFDVRDCGTTVWVFLFDQWVRDVLAVWNVRASSWVFLVLWSARAGETFAGNHRLTSCPFIA